MKLLFLSALLLSGCGFPVPIIIPEIKPAIYAPADNSRSSSYITAHGQACFIHIRPPTTVKNACNDALGCIIITWSDEKLTACEVVMVDNKAVAAHECGHLEALSLGTMTKEQVMKEQFNDKQITWNFLQLFYPGAFSEAAAEKPCGEGYVYTGVPGVGSPTGGRLLPLEAFDHEVGK